MTQADEGTTGGKHTDEEMHAEIEASRSIDVTGTRTVCLALGPYRNLTTWTAATLFLHPHVQVLNHAGKRVFGQPEVDFFNGFTPEKLTRFVQYAVQISAGGRGGKFGGSITHSHAFDDSHKMKAIFEEAGLPEVKDEIESLFWKESLGTTNQMRRRGLEPADLIDGDARVRFLQPVRHPLDCAVSNLKTGHYKRLRGLGKIDAPTVERVVQAILDEYAWYAASRSKNPDRFFHFFEHSLSRQTLVDLAAFLLVDPDEQWLDNAEAAMDIKEGYDHAPELVAAYRALVEQRFDDYPDLRAGLLAFVD
jgi:hypothetical protein